MSALWTAEALAAATGGALTPGCAGVEVNAVAIDTRSLAPGALFVALRGDNGDGHAHLADAFARGARCALVHAAPPDGAPCAVRVDDTRDGLAALGRAGRARFGGRVVAVTGSVGKTTTKEMLRAALAAHGATHAAEASHNNHWGVPLTLARLPADARFAVCELGTNHRGEIAPLAALARPDVAVVTAIGTSHIGLIGSRALIAAEKGAIFGALATPDGVAVLPSDIAETAILRDAVPANRRVVTFGADADASFRLRGTTVDCGRTIVDATLDGRPARFAVGGLGTHMARNALAVLATVASLGLAVAPSADALGSFRPGAGRGLTRPILGGEAVLLDESYNASAASVRAALDVLALLPARRRVAFLGDMLELGAFSAEEHRSLAAPAGAAADIVHTVGPESRALHAALPPERRGIWSPDAASLARDARALVRPGDAVLVKGSNGTRMRLVVAALAGPADT